MSVFIASNISVLCNFFVVLRSVRSRTL